MILPTPLAFFFFNDTATTEIYTLSLHDALPISAGTPIKASPPATRPSSTSIPNIAASWAANASRRSEEHTSELQSQSNLVCRLLLEKKKLHHEPIDHQLCLGIAHVSHCFSILQP